MIYLDNHATTPCDPRVVDAMLPWFTEHFGNPHSSSHQIGREAASAIEGSASEIGAILNVPPESILFTSGATESNNLAIDGICLHPRQKRRHIITSTVEHPAVLDVVARLEKVGFRVSRVGVHPHDHPNAGLIDLQQLVDALDEDTALVTVHWANNEMGAIQPIGEIARLAHEVGALVHSDATQAVGRIPMDLAESDVDLMSASAHKFYGPKGSGILTLGGGGENRRVRLKPSIVGGGQQRRLRSGTAAPANIIGLATALRFAVEERETTTHRVRRLRDNLYEGLKEGLQSFRVNGPSLDSIHRLPGNLNLLLDSIEGEAWMAATPEVAFSSGSACSSVDEKPSHVLLGLRLNESEARRCVRFGVGKFNTEEEIRQAIEQLVAGFRRIALSE